MHKTAQSIARAAVTAGLGLGLTFATFATPVTALAENGSITINQQHNEGAKYDAFMLFKADISDDDKATHVAWASDGMRDIVLAFLDQNGYGAWLTANHPGDGQRERAQNACEFIAYSITGSAEDTLAATTPRTTAGRSFANELAQALAQNNASPRQTATAGTAFTQPEGYWLFVTTDTTTEASGEAGTAPIWVPLGGSVKTIQEKSAVPSVDKEVREDSSQEWGKVADANVGQDLTYRLTATLPSNYAAFDTYHLKFTDTLSDGLQINVPSGSSIANQVTVKIGNQSVTVDGTNLKASYANNVLTVEFVDLKTDHWNNLNIVGNTAITVEYQAHITSSANLGSAGNTNTVALTYTDDPVSGGDGSIQPGPTTKTFAYQIKLQKVDEQTNEALSGAKFTVRVADNNTDTASRGLYVQTDGSLGDQAASFVTGADGSFLIPGIDEGIYVIKETEAPSGYELMDHEITLTVNSTLDGTELKLSNLTASATGGDDEDVNAATKTEVSSIDTSTGIITVNATNDRWLLLPLTGQEGLTSVAVMGAFLASTAGAGLWWRRRPRH